MLEADMGTPLVLTCHVAGVAVPAVTWLKDGHPLGVCAGQRCARLPPPASLLLPSKQSCLSFLTSNPAARDPQGCTGRVHGARRVWPFPCMLSRDLRFIPEAQSNGMWAQDVMGGYAGGELSGYQPLGCLLGQEFAPRPESLFSCKAPAVNSAKTLLCFNSVPKPGFRGKGGSVTVSLGRAQRRSTAQPLSPVSLQR